jgi:hypothetical protein
MPKKKPAEGDSKALPKLQNVITQINYLFKVTPERIPPNLIWITFVHVIQFNTQNCF